MIKKVSKADLRLGMFIHDLNCGWMEHSFLRNRFMLRKDQDLQKILESEITEVYIDTIKGIDCPDAPTEAEVQAELTARMLDTPQPMPPRGARTSHQEELGFAKRIQKEANKVIKDVLGDVRLGKQIQVERVHPVVEQITESILRNQGTLVSLCRIREGDTYTFMHSVSVCTLLVTFARYLELDPEIIHEAGMGGMLHDLGKMRVPDHILNKPGKLSDEEFAIMKNHVVLGLEVLRQTPGVSQTVVQVAGEHHERFEGNGYPERIKGQAISQLGQMAAIVDVYDALTSNRIYHRRMEPPAALTKLFEWSDHHFDSELVQHFIQAIGIYPVGSLVRLDSRRLAVVTEQGAQGLLFPKVRVVYDILHGRKIPPKDLDLSGPESGGDVIVTNEDPDAWGINPFEFLTLEA
ncbi:MAG: HD-GYP domain-containing protein [Holophaga sp.]